MKTLQRLTAEDLVAVVGAYRDALRAHQEVVNRLNVYPVPDGDTGTNMALTLESVITDIEGVDAASDMGAVCKALSHGSLMGARGNSGVILSQILRGLAGTFSSSDGIGPDELAAGLSSASEAAYRAVMRPVEGTMLTVVREASEAATSAAKEGASLVGVLDAARDAAYAALDRTPELLPVLKQAGVVDAGGAGFVLLLDAFLSVTDARPLPEAPELPAPAASGGAPAGEAEEDDEDDVSSLRYEVMYMLEASDESVPAFKDVWAGVGDSIVVVGGDGLWNCHIHTDDIGAALEAALDVGRPRNIRVTDLFEQVEEERWVREATGAEEAEEASGPPPATAVVAVGTGGGIRRIFRSLGVQRVVTGGQSMNPSTAQILEAIDGTPGAQVVVLPNNNNVVPVAEQAAAMSSKPVKVVPTRDIAEGFAALLAYDPQADAGRNATGMWEAASRVVAGEVTRAVRASDSDAGPVEEGDWIGLSRRGIEVVAGSMIEAATRLLDRLVGDDHEIVTIIEGEDSGAADTRRLTAWLSEHRPNVMAECHHGGQPMYPYLFSIE